MRTFSHFVASLPKAEQATIRAGAAVKIARLSEARKKCMQKTRVDALNNALNNPIYNSPNVIFAKRCKSGSRAPMISTVSPVKAVSQIQAWIASLLVKPGH